MDKRRGALFAFAAMAAVVTMASTAFACVTFMGKMEVEGDDGTTEVVGTGWSHSYCSDGRPTTAAAGNPGDAVQIKVKPGRCDDAGAPGAHQLPEGTYQVRYNNIESYTYDGTYWNMKQGLGCFRAANAATTSILGTFTVDAAGYGTWNGSIGLGNINGTPYFGTPSSPGLAVGTASNICIGAPSLPPVNGIIPGLLAPYQLLAI